MTMNVVFVDDDAPFDVSFTEASGQQIVLPEGGGGDYVLPPATTSTLGGIIVGDNLQITATGILSVVTTDEVAGDNTKPITSAAVYATIGNINAELDKKLDEDGALTNEEIEALLGGD